MHLLRVLLLVCLALVVQVCNAQELIFAVNEGVTYQDGSSVTERYKPLVDLLERELKHPIKVQAVDRYSNFETGLDSERYDLAFIHPAHIGLRAAKSGKYVGLVSAKDFTDYRARVFVKKDSAVKTLADLRDKKIGVPALDSITTVMFAANLIELGFRDPASRFSTTRFQDAVPFMVENGFVEAGVTGSGAIAKDWVAKGGRVIAETKPIPIKQFLASRKLNQEQRDKVQNLLIKLSENDAGKAALKAINIKGFVLWDNAAMTDATKRLGL
ncbi:MAG: phosphate/phosphite/phosphonate ABC transporter substrate-binding protein [Undibacterium umbellatum]|uniref:phosphate/phosphite/phosphonate ABC transporter substrate-binding protein n=1 Tax=Undibacterium umbellatum TaxID=2762300 RepID=UPI003BB620FC